MKKGILAPRVLSTPQPTSLERASCARGQTCRKRSALTDRDLDGRLVQLILVVSVQTPLIIVDQNNTTVTRHCACPSFIAYRNWLYNSELVLDKSRESSYDILYDVSCDVLLVQILEESMARYPLNLPAKLKQEAEQWAADQGVSLNQFILWSVAEKVGALKQNLDDPAFPRVTYRRGASGQPVPVLRGMGIRIQTVAVAAHQWDMKPDRIADEYGLAEAHVKEALAFYRAHRAEIDADLAAEQMIEAVND